MFTPDSCTAIRPVLLFVDFVCRLGGQHPREPPIDGKVHRHFAQCTPRDLHAVCAEGRGLVLYAVGV